MPRMIDLIRASAVPANLVQSAARGALAIPPQEMLEILVYLATDNKVFGDQAKLTLAGWDEAICSLAASSRGTAKPVLAFLTAPENFRPPLFAALLANPSVPEECLVALVKSLTRDVADIALNHDRVIHSEKILSALADNPNLNGIQSATIEERLTLLSRSHAPTESTEEITPPASVQVTAIELPPEGSTEEADEEVAKYISAHTAEITADAEKPFQPVGGIEGLPVEAINPQEPVTAITEIASPIVATAEGGTQAIAGAAAAAKTAPSPASPAAQSRGSALQRISKLDVKGRIQLAMKGSKEERALLVRDGTKIVALAVLDSPKISDSEVEKFASQKNVLEAVLRAIPLKRRFMKQYNIVRNLVFNPRTPIDVSLGLMKNILVADLK
ncbi:MAG: hypothetical protein ACRD2S_12190, partial [Terriglobales bacterium]